jgi:hypothetical protein
MVGIEKENTNFLEKNSASKSNILLIPTKCNSSLNKCS